MGPDDFMEPEVAVAVAVTAALSSPRARKVMRRGAVYGVAGILKARDALMSTAGGMQHSAAATAGMDGSGPEETPEERPARPTAHRRAAHAAKHEAEMESVGAH
jgi:hypothetical protein